MAKRRHKRNSTFQKNLQLLTYYDDELLMLLFADDQIIICKKKEDNLQKAAYKLNQTITEHILIMSTQKTKLMAYKG